MLEQYQLFDALSPEEYTALKDDIKQRGVLVAVELDENGIILDGHHRVKAWQELRDEGVELKDYPRIKRTFVDEAHKRNHIRALNIIRRHLSAEQKAKQWADMRADGMTYQEIAQTSGVDNKTVRNSVKDNSSTQPAVVIGKDGKKYPPKRKPRKPRVTPEAPTKTVYQSAAAVHREEKRAEVKATLFDIATQESKKIEGVFDVIVIDPPWPILKIV